MKTKDEIIEGLEICSKFGEIDNCEECPYDGVKDCMGEVMKDAYRLLTNVVKPVKIPESWKESVLVSFMKGE